MECGAVWNVGLCGMWAVWNVGCVECGAVWNVGLCGMWGCVECGLCGMWGCVECEAGLGVASKVVISASTILAVAISYEISLSKIIYLLHICLLSTYRKEHRHAYNTTKLELQ